MCAHICSYINVPLFYQFEMSYTRTHIYASLLALGFCSHIRVQFSNTLSSLFIGLWTNIGQSIINMSKIYVTEMWMVKWMIGIKVQVFGVGVHTRQMICFHKAIRRIMGTYIGISTILYRFHRIFNILSISKSNTVFTSIRTHFIVWV